MLKVNLIRKLLNRTLLQSLEVLKCVLEASLCELRVFFSVCSFARSLLAFSNVLNATLYLWRHYCTIKTPVSKDFFHENHILIQ